MENYLFKFLESDLFCGDFCRENRNSEHTYPAIQVLGSEIFLTKLLSYFPDCLKNLSLYNNHGNDSTMYFTTRNKKAMMFLLLIYSNCNIYLQRKYDKFINFCHLYKKLYSDKVTNIGEGCDANTEITEETKESSAS